MGLSHTTGQVTHHIAPDVDAERDRLVAELQQAGVVQSVEWLDGFHADLEGRNGGGDPWHTDGRLAIVYAARVVTGLLLWTENQTPSYRRKPVSRAARSVPVAPGSRLSPG